MAKNKSREASPKLGLGWRAASRCAAMKWTASMALALPWRGMAAAMEKLARGAPRAAGLARDAIWGAAKYPFELNASLRLLLGKGGKPFASACISSPGAQAMNPFACLDSGSLARLVVSLMGPAEGASALGKTESSARRHPLDAIDGMAEWEIGVDESLDARHPVVAMAWMRRASWIEQFGSVQERDACAYALACSMMGRGVLDGLHPDYAIDAHESRWAFIWIEEVCKKACEIRSALEEGEKIRSVAAQPVETRKDRSKSL